MNALTSLLLVAIGCPALLIFLAWWSQRKPKAGFRDDDGDPVTHDDICYCISTGAGEFIDGKLTGDTLVCLPCRLRAELAALERDGE